MGIAPSTKKSLICGRVKNNRCPKAVITVTMNEPHKYRATDKMSDLICDNYSLLMVMSRFGLSLGFGDRSVKDVCQAQGVDYKTFLAVAPFWP